MPFVRVKYASPLKDTKPVSVGGCQERACTSVEKCLGAPQIKGEFVLIRSERAWARRPHGPCQVLEESEGCLF